MWNAWNLLKTAQGARFARGTAARVAKKKRRLVSGRVSSLLAHASNAIMCGTRNVCQLKLSLYSI
jgi:hypothetical protein